jgi:hypothetical protein
VAWVRAACVIVLFISVVGLVVVLCAHKGLDFSGSVGAMCALILISGSALFLRDDKDGTP